jgi:hypothetical protein
MTERICGTCSLCCKLPYVAELNKSIDTWCQHARPGKGGLLDLSRAANFLSSFHLRVAIWRT